MRIQLDSEKIPDVPCQCSFVQEKMIFSGFRAYIYFKWIC